MDDGEFEFGHRAAGLPGRRAYGPRGRRGPWAAGRWAAGLLLAKPVYWLVLEQKGTGRAAEFIYFIKLVHLFNFLHF